MTEEKILLFDPAVFMVGHDYQIIFLTSTKGLGWIEIGGAGMVNPKVLELLNIDTEEYSGFAFGMGLERLVMRRYNIDDIRMLFENDVRFLESL